MRRATLVLVLLIAVAAESELQQPGGSRSHPSSSVAAAQPGALGRAEHLLTLLDFWNQELMPYVVLPQSRAHALVIGDVTSARRLDRQLRGLTHLQRLLADGVRDPLLRADYSVAARAVEADRVAWAEWTAANLQRRPPPAGRLAALEANAGRLNEAAYTAIDDLFRTAPKPVQLYGLPPAVSAVRA